MAKLDLIILWPNSGFTTNNHQILVRGYLEAAEGSSAIVSMSTPAGVQDLAATYHTLNAFSVDLGDRQEIAAVEFVPVEEQGLEWGPRQVRVSFSDDGQNFRSPVEVAIPLQQSTFGNREPVPLPVVRAARYVQVEMLEGWQADRIQIHQARFFNPSGDRLRARTATISLRLMLDVGHQAIFELPVHLRDGENRVMLQAQLEVVPYDAREHSDTEIIQLTRIPDLTEEHSQQGYFVLSDGWQMELSIPMGALDETLQGIEVFKLDPNEIPRSSFRDHQRIAPGTSPVLAYRFLIAHRTMFPATATAFLETHPPPLAVDGRFEYPSTWITSLVPLPVSWTVDFGERRSLGGVSIHARVDGGESFGPQKATFSISEDGNLFREIFQYDSFEDQTTQIALPEPFQTRFLRMTIEESKQANNIQINEIELFDDTGSPIVPLSMSDRVTFERPIKLQVLYEMADLDRASIADPTRLAFFIWNAQANRQGGGFWQFAGGQVVPEKQSVSVQLNHLAPVALFETKSMPIEAVWSFNPFSPDGNGVADTTGLTLYMPSVSDEEPTELSIELFDLSGRRIKSLLEREPITTNSIHVEWDGTDRTGHVVPIGPYIYQVQTADEIYRGMIVVAK